MPQTSVGLICRKVGMTRLFREDGTAIPSSILVTASYFGYQPQPQHPDLTAGNASDARTNSFRIRKPQLGQHLKTNSHPGSWVRPSGPPASNRSEQACPIRLTDYFRLGQKVQVRGKSIGKGFAGTIKRHGFKSGRASHGNSKAHNKLGSTGMTQDPGRVFAGKLMPGHLGHKNVSVRNLEIVFLTNSPNLLVLKGSIPGHIGSRVLLFSGTQPKTGD